MFVMAPTNARTGEPGPFGRRGRSAWWSVSAKAQLGRDAIDKQIRTMGALVRSSTPDELKTHIAAEIAKWKGVREKAGIEQEQ
jgi:tripartite-type tricarboxylate transporter receptor subunit TctC